MSQLFEYGSAVDIILRAKNPITIAGKAYKAGEIYTILRDVGVQFNYNPINSEMEARKTLYRGDTQNLPQSVSTSYVPLTTAISDLIFTPVNVPQKVQVTEQRSSDSDGRIILREKAVADTIFVYGDDGALSFGYDETTNSVQGLIGGQQFSIYYCTKVNGTAYELEQCYQPYFEAEIIGKGNTNKSTNNMHIVLPAVKVDANPSLTFVDNGQIGLTLTLNIIYKQQDKPVVVFR